MPNDRKAEQVITTNDGGIISDRRLYLTRAKEGVVGADAGQRVVEEGHADAAYLLAGPGDTIPAEQVKALGLEVVGGKVKQPAKAAESAVVGDAASYDQETGPALKRAAEARRAADVASGRTQTEVAVTAPPPGAEDMARDDSDEVPAQAKVAPSSAKKSAAKKS